MTTTWVWGKCQSCNSYEMVQDKELCQSCNNYLDYIMKTKSIEESEDQMLTKNFEDYKLTKSFQNLIETDTEPPIIATPTAHAPNSYQVGGSHYQRVEGEQLWDRIWRVFGSEKAWVYFVGTVMAYIERYRYKDGIDDLRKARHYIDKLIELELANCESKEQITGTTKNKEDVCQK